MIWVEMAFKNNIQYDVQQFTREGFVLPNFKPYDKEIILIEQTRLYVLEKYSVPKTELVLWTVLYLFILIIITHQYVDFNKFSCLVKTIFSRALQYLPFIYKYFQLRHWPTLFVTIK